MVKYLNLRILDKQILSQSKTSGTANDDSHRPHAALGKTLPKAYVWVTLFKFQQQYIKQ